MKAKIFAVALASALLLMACQDSGKAEPEVKQETEQKQGQKADDGAKETKNIFKNYTADTLNGIKTNTHTVFDQAELTVVYIWDLSCDSCKEDMKVLGEIGRENAGWGVQVLGIVRGVNEENRAEAVSIMEESKADYVQMIASDEMEEQLLNKYSGSPVTLMVASDGQILDDVLTDVGDKAHWTDKIGEYHSKVCVNDHPADCGVG